MMRISAHVDEHGATVVEISRGVQVGDHNTMRNDFSYKLTGQEISLERMLHDHADLAQSLAMTVRPTLTTRPCSVPSPARSRMHIPTAPRRRSGS